MMALSYLLGLDSFLVSSLPNNSSLHHLRPLPSLIAGLYVVTETAICFGSRF
jgi:hypothetical protein